jgi:osmotically-inducible protein OsmY
MGALMIDSGFQDITCRIKLLLAESPLAEVRQVRVEQDGDRVVLFGRVRTFYAKQMAQETIRPATSGLHIVNSLAVDN